MAKRSSEAAALRALVQRFVRGFGLLDESKTPCGKPLHSSHAHALMVLLAAGEAGLHQAALARELGLDKSSASRLVRQLAGAGRVAVASVPDEDARLRRVRLTAKGARVAAEVDAASRRRFGELLGAIAPSQRKVVLRGLQELAGALERKKR